MIGVALVPRLFWSFVPDEVRALSPEEASFAFFWRLQFYLMKATGGAPELSWAEIIDGTRPGGFITDAMIKFGSSLDDAIENRLVHVDDISSGKSIFLRNCAACHGNDARGGHGPSLAKANYRVGSSDWALYKTVRDGISGTAMPSIDLSIDERWQVIGFLRTLDSHSSGQSTVANRAPPIDISWDALVKASGRTDEWLTYSGSLDGWRHSALREITTSNVSGLKLRWAHQFSAKEGVIQATPIVANKTIFITEPPNTVVALDAGTGREIWKYANPIPENLPLCCAPVNRGLAVLGDHLFMGTLDAKLVALDASTGKVQWKVQVAEPSEGFTITGAPLIARDVVIIGVSGGEYGIRGFLAAYDAKTGEKRWRFDTIPGPGEIGHETWENSDWKTGGGPTWITGSFDPDLNLLYWGVGNPSPNFSGDVRPGDNLFTESVIALDATTGKLVWYFQFTPHDEHDWDSNQTPVLVDVAIDGVERKIICWANRNGFYYVLDRTNGEFLHGVPFVEETWASGLDSKGRPILTEAAKVTTGGILARPNAGGGTNWLPPSYDPGTRSFLVHATEGASVYTKSPPDKVKRGQGGLYMGSGQSEPQLGTFVVKALDVITGAKRWEYTGPQAQTAADHFYSGVLSTGGGVSFSASAGTAFALDTATGTELWRAGLGGRTQATPISFLMNGHQVVAISAGTTLFVFGL
jgi:alcohol dehydrogenase (cytochrome c)